jgi:hypothetical protein
MLDKHTKRYLFEEFGHSGESVGMFDMVDYIKRVDSEDDAAYVSSAIKSEFEGVQQTYLTTALFDQIFKRKG